MKKAYILVLIIWWASGLHAQSIERQVIGTTGSYNEVVWGSISSTTGEVVVKTASTSVVVLTQGFQQPLLSDTTGSIVDLSTNSVVVYPNPTAGIVNIQSSLELIVLRIYDASGKVVSPGSIEGNTLDISNLERGVYILEVVFEHSVSYVRLVRD